MKKITYILIVAFSVFLFSQCEKYELGGTKDLNYVTFEGRTYDFGVDIDGANEREIIVYTTQITGSDRDFNVVVDTDVSTADPASYVVPSSVTIPANSNEGVLKVKVSDVNIGDTGETLVLKLVSEDGLYVGDPITLSISRICPLNEVVLKIVFDGYASECSWELYDSADEIVASGGPWADGTANFTTKFCLDNGDYTFVIYDAYGDGLSYPNNGSATLTYNGTVLASVVGDFGTVAVKSFSVSK